jgi:carboxyl-terminal processing protease
MKIFYKTFYISISLILLLAGAFFAGYYYHAHWVSKPSELPILHQAYSLLLQHGLYDPPQTPGLEYGMIRGMLEAYNDPYTIFSPPAQAELNSNNLQGSFGGIGAEIGNDSQGFFVLYPYPEGPAGKAGVPEGARLLAVDSHPILPHTSLDEVLAALRGPVGTTVTITVSHPPDENAITVTILREEISQPSVVWRLDSIEPRLGIVKVNIIAASTPDEIQNALHNLISRGATHFVLDLRDNFGGLLDASIDTAALFLQDGVIIEQQYRNQPVETFRVESSGPFIDLPLIILVNQHTASAAEIIAGALRANDRALLIGSTSYGKDTIQLIFQLNDGSSINVTTAKWWLPGINFPQSGMGLQPDIMIEPDSSNHDAALLAAINQLFNKNSE